RPGCVRRMSGSEGDVRVHRSRPSGPGRPALGAGDPLPGRRLTAGDVMAGTTDARDEVEDVLELTGESPEELYAVLAENGWGDGLPVVAPTPERVDAMLAGYPGRPDEVLAVLPPRSGAATPRTVAVNAVMAGCPPPVFPVLVAAVRGIGRPEFN